MRVINQEHEVRREHTDNAARINSMPNRSNGNAD